MIVYTGSWLANKQTEKTNLGKTGAKIDGERAVGMTLDFAPCGKVSNKFQPEIDGQGSKGLGGEERQVPLGAMGALNTNTTIAY